MLIIIDANVSNEMVCDEAGVIVVKYISNRKLKLSICKKLINELSKTKLRPLIVEWSRAGLVYKVDDQKYRAGELAIKSKKLRSNDAHVIVLALVSGARILFSKDQDLHADFKDISILNNPQGRVYQDKSHEHILREAQMCHA